jgi:hypothetical protein
VAQGRPHAARQAGGIQKDMDQRGRGIGLAKATARSNRDASTKCVCDERSEGAVEDRDCPPGPAAPEYERGRPRRYLSDGERVHHSKTGHQTGNPQGTGRGSRVCQLGTPTNQKKSSGKEEPSLQGDTG